jgi:predicted unusual protein kinase regulating ubiquinone biosynthesis (AarF/ABC1/UbiB family)
VADDEDKGSREPTSRRKRFMKLAGMTASVAGNYAKGRVQGIFQDKEARLRGAEEANAANGARIAKTLGELKGAAMKIGQFASTAHDLLPAELVSGLTKLQGEAPPMHFDVISDQIERELGSPPGRLFDWFDEEPFAAASIGQVHRARTDDGREVVVKVQYPGVDKSVDSDIFQLKLALRASGLIKVRRSAIDALFKELSARLHEELDYTNEAENVRKFRRLHADDPHIIIPEVVGERSSGRVLTLTYEAGDPIGGLDAAGYDQETRNLLGRRLIQMMYRQIFELHALHADPNPANFACRPNGDLVVYDFGCVKVVSRQMIADYKRLMLALWERDYDQVDAMAMALEVRVPGSEKPPRKLYVKMRQALSTVWLAEGGVDFGASKAHEAWAAVLLDGIKQVGKMQPSHLMAFTDRVQGGHHQNLIDIRAVVDDFHDLYFSYLQLPQLGDEGFEERMKKVPNLYGNA